MPFKRVTSAPRRSVERYIVSNRWAGQDSAGAAGVL